MFAGVCCVAHASNRKLTAVHLKAAGVTDNNLNFVTFLQIASERVS